MSDLIAIPSISHPLGQYWRQPNTQEILIDDEHALMTEETFSQLQEYSCTTPTGVYPGKCWKSNRGPQWFLRWFAEDDGDPRGLPTPTRKIVIV